MPYRDATKRREANRDSMQRVRGTQNGVHKPSGVHSFTEAKPGEMPPEGYTRVRLNDAMEPDPMGKSYIVPKSFLGNVYCKCGERFNIGTVQCPACANRKTVELGKLKPRIEALKAKSGAWDNVVGRIGRECPDMPNLERYQRIAGSLGELGKGVFQGELTAWEIGEVLGKQGPLVTRLA